MKSFTLILVLALSLVATAAAEARPRLFRSACSARPAARSMQAGSQGCAGGQCSVFHR